jgi:Virulence-associated protein E
MTNEEYTTWIDNLLTHLTEKKTHGQTIDVAECACTLDMGRYENHKIRDFVKDSKLDVKEFDAIIRREQVKKELGEYPSSAREFVRLIIAKLNVTVTYNGLINKKEQPHIVSETGTIMYITPDKWDTEPFKAIVQTMFHTTIGFDTFMRTVRMRCKELDLPFQITELNDASEHWYEAAMDYRLIEIADQITYHKPSATTGQDSLYRLAQTCFDVTEMVPQMTGETDADVADRRARFVVAIFNKFIWQVKRKINKMPITDHLMAVILGSQGVGKSTLIRKMLAVIEELMASTDFKQMTDDRNSMLWRNFVLFLDEMGWAKKAEMDTVKHIISAPILTRRIMQTTKYNTVVQNATFIGTANAGELSEIIRDTSGTRRFVTLQMIDEPDRQAINEIDWLAVWQSVDENADDPTLPFKEVLQATQAEDRIMTTVEAWLDQLTKHNYIGCKPITDSTPHTDSIPHSSSELFGKYHEWENVHYKASTPMTSNAFGRELKRRSLPSKAGAKFERKERDHKAVFYWVGGNTDI